MAKKHKKNKTKPKNSVLTVSSSATQKLSLAQRLILYSLIASVFLLFSMQVNSHFTLPKLAAIVFLTNLLLITFVIVNRQGYLQTISPFILISLLCLLGWWGIGISQAINIKTALEGQVGRYNGFYTHLTMVILFLVMTQLQISKKQFRSLLNVVYFFTAVLCLHAICQYFSIDPILGVRTSRPFATIGNPVALGVILIMIIPFIFSDIVHATSGKQRLFLTGLLTFTLFTLFATGSRGPLLGFIASSLVFLFFYKNAFNQLKNVSLKLIVSLLLITTCLFYFFIDWSYLGERFTLDVSIKMRLMYFEAALKMISDNLLFGYGFESFRLMYPLYRPVYDASLAGRDTTPTMVHNDYLQLATDNGVMALLLFLLFVATSLWFIYKAILNNPSDRGTLIPFIVSIVAYLVQSMSGWLEISSFVMFWLILGIGVSLSSQSLNIISLKSSVNTKQVVNVISIVSFVFLIYYGIQINNFYEREKNTRLMIAYHAAGDIKKTNVFLSRLNKISEDNAYYLDKIGGVYLDRLSRNKSDSAFNYNQAHKYFSLAQTLNPYNPYFRLNLMIADTIAIHRTIITTPSSETLHNMTELENIDPNNPSVFETRAKLYGVLGEKIKQALDLVRIKQILNNN
jgi:O-antigen ligase